MAPLIETGAVVDGFTVGEPLHSGAMGNIFRVTHPADAKGLIMKVPRVGPNEPPEGIIAFETEATVLPALTGVHVPRVVAAGDLARTPYLVTEWIDGCSVEELSVAGRLSPTNVAKLGATIADALHSVHAQDAIHLDVKPANVIIGTDGIAVLIDFGFAHHARYPDLLAEETRHSAGSKPYISPEQLLGTREDPRSDLFALGVMLYELVTQRFPFGEPDTDVRNRFWIDPVPPRAVSPDTPAWLQEIVLRCLEVDPEKRYQTAAHVAFDLRNPDQVALTARAAKMKRATFTQHVRRFARAYGQHAKALRSPQVQVGRFPIVMIAVDTMHPDDDRQPAIRRAAQQVLSLSTELRVICVSVIGTQLMDSREVSASASHLEHLVRLRHWVAPLEVPAQRLSLHAIEAPDPAEALLEFARLNNVDLILLGAPGPAQPGRTWWKSVASTVTANAHCSVHVVRVPEKKPWFAGGPRPRP